VQSVLRSLLGTAKETRSSLLLVSQQLADAHERATLESIATAVVYLRANAQAHEILLTKHRYCQTPQTEEVTFEGSTFAAVVNPSKRFRGPERACRSILVVAELPIVVRPAGCVESDQRTATRSSRCKHCAGDRSVPHVGQSPNTASTHH
jgi:hypothetical protein